MILRNNDTGDEIGISCPDETGASTVSFNGEAKEKIFYSELEGTVTIEDGRVFKAGMEFYLHLLNASVGWTAQ
ncbi:MAG TPA: hypothetical protein VFW94_23855 [Candidatus Acidoferrales bacterium]|nr:hypothetical protein [Candidatus Acidoferrales bacterium]